MEAEETREDRVTRVYDIAKAMPKRQPYMAGYPKYVSLGVSVTSSCYLLTDLSLIV